MISCTPFRVATLLPLGAVDRCEELRAPLAACCCGRGQGSLLIAREGVNGTVTGDEAAIAELIAYLEAMPGFAEYEVKYSSAGEMPFHRMKVRLKPEIVTLRVPDIDPRASGRRLMSNARTRTR